MSMWWAQHWTLTVCCEPWADQSCGQIVCGVENTRENTLKNDHFDHHVILDGEINALSQLLHICGGSTTCWSAARRATAPPGQG